MVSSELPVVRNAVPTREIAGKKEEELLSLPTLQWTLLVKPTRQLSAFLNKHSEMDGEWMTQRDRRQNNYHICEPHFIHDCFV